MPNIGNPAPPRTKTSVKRQLFPETAKTTTNQPGALFTENNPALQVRPAVRDPLRSLGVSGSSDEQDESFVMSDNPVRKLNEAHEVAESAVKTEVAESDDAMARMVKPVVNELTGDEPPRLVFGGKGKHVYTAAELKELGLD